MLCYGRRLCFDTIVQLSPAGRIGKWVIFPSEWFPQSQPLLGQQSCCANVFSAGAKGGEVRCAGGGVVRARGCCHRWARSWARGLDPEGPRRRDRTRHPCILALLYPSLWKNVELNKIMIIPSYVNSEVI